MTTISQRRCGNCAFFEERLGSCFGSCSHEARQSATGVPVSVRRQELACRTEWNADFWKLGTSELDPPVIIVNDVIVWTAVPESLPLDEWPDDLLDMIIHAASDEQFDIRDWLPRS